MKINGWLLAVASAALIVMAPGLADPYQMPRLLVLGLVVLPLLLRPSSFSCHIEVPIVIGLLAWAVAATHTQDNAYTLVGAYLQPFDGFIAVVVYAGLAVGVARLGAELEETAAAICWASLPVSAYAIVQHFIGNRDPMLPEALPNAALRVVATQGSPIYLGAVLAIVIACAIWLVGRRRGLAAAALSLAIPALWFTGTRGAMLGAGAAVLVLLPGRARWILAAAGIAVLAFHTRAGSLNSDLGRLEIWREAWAVFRDHPLFGSGPGTFGIISRGYITPAYVAAHRSGLAASQHAHNELLQVLATTGLVGLAGYTVVIVGLVIVWIESRSRELLLAVAAAYAVPAALNPAPHASVALLAMVFGAAAARISARSCGTWVYAPIVACSVFICGRLVAADYHFAGAIRSKDTFTRAELFNRAAQLNMWEMRYTCEQVNSAIALLGSLPEPQRKPLAAGLVQISRQALAAHPGDSFAHELLGRTILTAILLGLPENANEALDEYERAQELAPTFPPLMLRRRALARAIGQESRARKADLELERIRSWEQGGA